MPHIRSGRGSFVLAAPDDDTAHECRPRLASRVVLRAVARRSIPRVVEATVIPGALLWVCAVVMNLWLAMVVVLVWSYGVMLRHRLAGRPISGLLALAVLGLTIRTAIAMGSGNAVIYFLQPIGTTTLVAVAFLASVVVGRPLVTRLAHDFCPLGPGVAARPAVARLFRDLTLMWSALLLVKAVATLVMLAVLSLPVFVASRALANVMFAVIGFGLTATWSLRTAHREGLAFAPAPSSAPVLVPVG
jgi:hypothetical protein